MSELKVYHCNEWHNEYTEFYLKHEADTVITELKAENRRIKLSVEQILSNLSGCGLIKEWFFNGAFRAVLKADDPHLQIAELKQKLHDAEMRADLAEAANTEYRIDLKNIKDNIAKHARNQYHKYNRQTLRALWLARAYRAEARKNYWYARSCHEGDERLWSIDGSAVKYIGCIKRTNFAWLKVWSEVECKCLAKAEKFKEA